MRQDVRFALRMILTHRWFSLAVVATLALGIGLNTMVFTLVDAVLFKAVAIPGGARLVAIVNRNASNPRSDRNMSVSWPDFIDYRAQTRAFEGIEAGSGDEATLSEQGIAPQHYNMFRVSTGLFGLLHVSPVRGRDFTAADSKNGAGAVVLIGNSIWRNRYGGRDVVGHIVRLNGKPVTIAGVMPEGFRFPSGEDLWVPLQADKDADDRAHRSLQLFGIVKSGASPEQASSEFDVIAHRIAAEHPKEDKDIGVSIQTFHERYAGGEVRIVFSLLMAAVGLVLLIACANVANMMLGRAIARRREISIRAAMGASRWQLVRQLLIESLMLSTVGGGAGLGLCVFGVHSFDLALQDVGKPYWIQFVMDYRVFFYFGVVCVLSALLFGLVPALRSSGLDVNTTLKDNSRGAGSQRGGKLSGILVVFQFGLTLVLLLGAGVFMRSFVDKQSVNPFVPADRIMTARINLPGERYKDDVARRAFFDRLLPRIAALPGVDAVSITSNLPGTGSDTRHIEIEGAPVRDEAQRPVVRVVVQSPGYIANINLPILRGRDFNALDGAPGQLHAIVTRDFAARYWARDEALGKRFRFFEKAGPGEWISVVGVSGDLVQQPLDAEEIPLLFVPWRQMSYDSMSLLVRAANPSNIASALRTSVQSLDEDLPLFDVRTMTDVTWHQIWFLKVFGTIFSVFAAVALLMASIGIYAVMAQATGARTREIGVRMALGATSGSILGLVLTRGVWQLIAGLGLGIAAIVPATRVLGTLGFLDAPSDPVMIASLAAMLSVVGLFACWLPARRAAALNPVSAIRDE